MESPSKRDSAEVTIVLEKHTSYPKPLLSLPKGQVRAWLGGVLDRGDKPFER
jgi:hypothetical protein